jgi:hypothetical protein
MDFNTETYHLWFPLHLCGSVAKAGETEMIPGAGTQEVSACHREATIAMCACRLLTSSKLLGHH